jgi:hypothetical protein
MKQYSQVKILELYFNGLVKVFYYVFEEIL